MPNSWILEGCDRLGKSSLVKGIKNRLGFHQVIHFGKPEVLDIWFQDKVNGGATEAEAKAYAFEKYQRKSFSNMFALMRSTANIIFDRAHLGEAVYADLYRGYSGDFVFELERRHPDVLVGRNRLILLTEDFEHSRHFLDDGLSFDPAKRQEEQALFIRAYNKSQFVDKRIICVTDPLTGGYRDKEDILAEALRPSVKIREILTIPELSGLSTELTLTAEELAGATTISRLAGRNVYHLKLRHLDIFLTLTEMGEPELFFCAQATTICGINGFISRRAVTPLHLQGQGLMSDLFVIVKRFLKKPIFSDDQHTEAGNKLWASLEKRFYIQVLNTKTGELVPKAKFSSEVLFTNNVNDSANYLMMIGGRVPGYVDMETTCFFDVLQPNRLFEAGDA